MTSNRPVSPAPPGLTRSRLSAVYGDLSQPENLALVESIRRLGVQTPILVDLDSAEVLDGWHRYQAAALAGVECPAVSVFTLSVGQRIALVESGNAHRRHSAPGHLVKAVIDTRLAELGPQAEVDTQALADTYGLTRRRVQQLAAQARREMAGDVDPEEPTEPPAPALPAGPALDLDAMLEMASDRTEAQGRAARDRRDRLIGELQKSLEDLRGLWPGAEEVTGHIEAAGRGFSGGAGGKGPGGRRPAVRGWKLRG